MPLLLLVAALGLRIAEPRILRTLEFGVFDTFQRAWPRAYEAAPVRVVDLDDASLERVGQWPWPRTRVAELVDRLTELGAAVIAFDVVFAEPDRTSPARVSESLPDTPEWSRTRERLRRLPDNDDVLAQAFARSRVVTGFSLTSKPGGRSPQPRAGFTWGGPDPLDYLPPLDGAVTTLPQLEAAAEGNGNFSLAEERDHIFRYVPLVFSHQGRLVPSLAAEALRVAFGASSYGLRSVGASGTLGFGEATGIIDLRIGPLHIPTDDEGRIWLHYTSHRPERLLPAWRVLAGEVDPDLVREHIVFVGTSAEGLKDLRATPLDPVMPGVLLHAQATEQILLQHFLQRPDWALGAELLFMLALGLLLIALQRRLGALGSALLALGAIAAAVVFSAFAFLRWHLQVDPVYPSVAALLVYLAGSLLGFLKTEAERRQIREAFGRYLSPVLVSELASHPERLALGGEQRPLTLLFADIRGFTALSERMADAQALTRLINRFLTPMTAWILECGGTIDKYIGDCIMAFWNAPLDDPEHARHACRAALGMQPRLAALNAELRQEAELAGREPEQLRIGVGINTGECCVGNLGSDVRFDYSAVGDTVNLASRLEGQCKEYGVDVILGEGTQRAVADFATLELDRIRVRGKLQEVAIFTLLGDEQRAASPEFAELREQHGELLRALRAGEWDAATRALTRCRALAPELGRLYDFYAARIAGQLARIESTALAFDDVEQEIPAP